MSAEVIMIIEKITSPLTAQDPCGKYLKYESVYDLIREARKEEADYPQGVWKRAIKKADWVRVEELCLEVLENRSKDLQIAAWMLEALVNRRGFSGLQTGLEIMSSLTEKFWDRIYPPIKEDDVEARIAPFIWINERLSQTLISVPITCCASEENYSWYDWDKANKRGTQDSTGDDGELGPFVRTTIMERMNCTPISFYQDQAIYIRNSGEIIKVMGNFLDRQCGKESPSFGILTSALEEIGNLITEIMGWRNIKASTEIALQPAIQNTSHIQIGPSITSRADAYALLSAAADYLIAHEPHSPVPYLVRRAISWGPLDIDRLLVEIVHDQQTLYQLFTLLGIKPVRPD